MVKVKPRNPRIVFISPRTDRREIHWLDEKFRLRESMDMPPVDIKIDFDCYPSIQVQDEIQSFDTCDIGIDYTVPDIQLELMNKYECFYLVYCET